MEKISQKDFNLDMDSYISKRRRSDDSDEGFDFSKLIPKVPKLNRDRIPKKEIEASTQERVYDEPEYEDEFEEYEGRGLLQKFMDFFRREAEEFEEELAEEIEEIERHTVPDDIKKALKIQNRWLERLPDFQIRAFKKSEDFTEYKRILEKYNLLKK